MINIKEIADYVVKTGTSKGASYVEARVIDSFDESYTARNGRFLGVLDNHKVGMGLRVILDGGMAFGSTEDLDKNNIGNLLDNLMKMARASKRKQPIIFSEENIEQTSWQVDVKIPFKDIAREEKQQYIKDLDKRLKSEVGKNLKNRISYLLLYTEDKYIATSEGAQISSKSSLASMLIMNTAKGKNGTEQRFISKGATAGWEWIEEDKLSDFIVEDCQNLVKAALNARAMKFEKPIDVVISGEVSGIMAHENVGHPSEGDRILGREGAQAGESFYGDLLQSQNLGEVVLGNEIVSIIDDPTLLKGPGFYLYDDEGVKAKPRYLIKNGRLNELLINREYAARLNTKSTAAARAVTYAREPISRMANTYFEPGEYSVEELIEDVKEGIFMKSFTEWNIDDRRFQSKYVGLEVYLIKNGKLTETMVKRPILELTTKGILGNMDAVGNDFFSTIGLCGKGDPMQGIPVTIGGPSARLRNISVGGA